MPEGIIGNLTDCSEDSNVVTIMLTQWQALVRLMEVNCGQSWGSAGYILLL